MIDTKAVDLHIQSRALYFERMLHRILTCLLFSLIVDTAVVAQTKPSTPKEIAPQDTAPAIVRPGEEHEMRLAEQMPEPGYSYQTYLASHIVYPKQAVANAVSGIVYVNFQVGADGQIRDVQLMKGFGYGCDEEAVRVISRMPAWKPGRQHGKAVPVRVQLPVQFALNR